MIPDMKIEYTSKLSRNEQSRIIHEVILHDRSSVGAGTPKPVNYGARIGGTLVGGICGHMEMHRLYIEYLWVKNSHRGKGIASNLLETVENDAAQKGCTESRIESLSIATASIYTRKGYKIIHSLPDYIPGLPLFVLSKKI